MNSCDKKIKTVEFSFCSTKEYFKEIYNEYIERGFTLLSVNTDSNYIMHFIFVKYEDEEFEENDDEEDVENDDEDDEDYQLLI